MYVSRRCMGIQKSWNLYTLLVKCTHRVTWCTGFSSDCCDNTPGRSNLSKAGSFMLTVQGCSRHVREGMAAGVRPLVTLCPMRRQQE